MTTKRVIGILSGTSMDGISLGLFEFSTDTTPKTVAATAYPLPSEYKPELLAMIKSNNCNFDTYGQMDHYIGKLFADAIIRFLEEYNIDPSTVDAIGSHGQTLWHAPQLPKPFTLQIGDPNIIAATTGITTIADFRRADMAAGGCGAPLAPAFHLAVFGDPQLPRCIVNIGGFSNISILDNGNFRGHDCGPGNCLLDYWVKEYFSLDYDTNGALASTGNVNPKLLQIFLDDPFFARPAPKSTGREYFNPAWLENKLAACKQSVTKLEVLTTLLHLTAITISNEIKRYAPPNTQVYICGGGAHNRELLKQLNVYLEQEVQTTAILGIDPDHVESALFAWLAHQRLNNQPIDLQKITGSKNPVILGGIFASYDKDFRKRAKRSS